MVWLHDKDADPPAPAPAASNAGSNGRGRIGIGNARPNRATHSSQMQYASTVTAALDDGVARIRSE